MDNLETIKRGVEVQIADINVELSRLIAAGLGNGARATSLAAQRSKLLAGLRELDTAIHKVKNDNMHKRMGNG